MRPVLAILSVLFLARVLGQFMAQTFGPEMLPSTTLWHSGAMSYESLLTAQCVILALMFLGIVRFGQMGGMQNFARFLLVAGVLYASCMAVRFVIGASGLYPESWWDNPISTPFHLVLAAWVLVFGYGIADDLLRNQVRALVHPLVMFAAYPVVVGGAVALYVWLLRHHATAQFASYLAVILSASAIVIFELATPYRRSWTPDRRHVVQDAVYLFVVQIALPAALTLAIVKLASEHITWTADAAFWPHDWPIAAQAALMLVLADFLRYWLHRFSHRWKFLWRLHAVHHSPEVLYFLNVGRFHPVEKAIQFLLDAAPFVLIGVAPEVVAAYFVFYAINGFFQHSNVDVRLGPLNWIVAGPELHRWHHSRIIAESDNNFGNNLIIWDTVFATRFFPERSVGELGLRNQSFPDDFLGQFTAPITTDPSEFIDREPR